MVGNPGDGSTHPASPHVMGSPGADGGSPPVLGGVSEAELDAFVSKLRTDKNVTVPSVTQSSAQ